MTSSIPKTTKAWTYTKGGLPRQALHLTTDHPYPVFPPTPNSNAQEEEWILVRVSYAALNPGEVVIMNLLPSIMRTAAKTPKVPGCDLAGEVLDISPSPDNQPSPPGRIKKGDKIVAFVVVSHVLSTCSGALQEVIAFPSKYAVVVPPLVGLGRSLLPGDRQGAGLLLAGCTALQQVRNTGVGKGDKVLVYGASGGVGSMAVQIAREVVGGGGKVVGVCSQRNVEVVLGLGCDEVVDYRWGGVYRLDALGEVKGGEWSEERVEDRLGGLYGRDGEEGKFDGVVDGFGSMEVYRKCAGFLKSGGVYSAVGLHADGYGFLPVLKVAVMSIANLVWPRAAWLGGTGRTWKAVAMFDPGREMMEYLVGLLGEGRLRVVVDSEWGFEEVLEGYDVLLSGRARGKIRVRMSEE